MYTRGAMLGIFVDWPAAANDEDGWIGWACPPGGFVDIVEIARERPVLTVVKPTNHQP